MGKQYFWLGGNLDFTAGANWLDASNSQTGTVPGVGDIVQFAISAGGTLSGTGAVNFININGTGVGFTGVISTSTLDVISNTLTPTPFLASLTIDAGRVAVDGFLNVADAVSSISILHGGFLSATGAQAMVSFGRITLNTGTLSAGILQEFNSIVAQRGTINIATSLQMGNTGSLDLTSSTLVAKQVFLGNTGSSNTTGTWNAAVGDLGSLIIGNLGTASITITGASAIVTGDNAGQLPALAVGSAGSGTLFVSGASSVTSEGNSFFANSGTAAVTVETSGTLTVRGTLTEASNTSARSSLTVTDTGSLLTIDADDIIGGSGTAVDKVQSGGSLNVAGALRLGAVTGTGSLSVDGAGTQVTAAAGAVIGQQGVGVLALTGGATVNISGAILNLAQAETASGIITLSGASTILKATAGLTVGQNGVGGVTINAGATLDTGGTSVFAGDEIPGTGTITVTGAAAQLLGGTGANIIGNRGAGTLLISNQGTAAFAGGFLTLGAQAASTGSIDVNGSAASLTAGNFVIGRLGAGVLTVAGTATAFAENKIVVGQDAGGQGSIDVTGGGTLLTNGDLTIGESGAGTINVNAGRFSVLGDVTLGQLAGGAGTLSLTGSGLKANVLTIGAAGTGLVSVGDNTKLRGLSIAIGATAGGSGTLTVDGSGTLPPLVQSDGALTIGASSGSTGLVTIGGSATVTATSIAIASTGTVTLSGGTLGGGPVQSQGTITGQGTIDGALTNTATVQASGGLLAITGAIDGAGTLNIVSGATLELKSSTTATQRVAFAGGTLKIDTLSATHVVINAFGAGDTIDILGLAADGADFAGGLLDLTAGGAGVVGMLSIAGGYTSSDFHVSTIGGNTTEITFNVIPCFAAGTRILTPSGPRVVEDLAVGDIVFDGGREVPIAWVGSRNFPDLRRHPHPHKVQPILIEADAIGEGRPLRDLVVSPDHALYLEGHLIPAKALLNGATIRQLDRSTVRYFHIELPHHGLLLAEGVAAESYLETGNRGAFANGGPAIQLHPDFAQSLRNAAGCAPFAVDGPAVEAARAAILDRADITTTDDPALVIRFHAGTCIIETRADIPGELSPDPRDRRLLGVKIAALSIAGRNIPLYHEALCEGWHDAEPDGRWTNGRAVIPQALLRGTCDVQVKLAGTCRYRMPAAAFTYPGRSQALC